MTLLDATLPFPPSLNAAVRHLRSGGHYLSHEAKAFRFAAIAVLKNARQRCHIREPIKAAVAVELHLYPPDRRRRDADNRIKPVLDALELAGVVHNDSLCRDVRVVMHDDQLHEGGRCDVIVRAL